MNACVGGSEGDKKAAELELADLKGDERREDATKRKRREVLGVEEGWRRGKLIVQTLRIIIVQRGEMRSELFFGILNFF